MSMRRGPFYQVAALGIALACVLSKGLGLFFIVELAYDLGVVFVCLRYS